MARISGLRCTNTATMPKFGKSEDSKLAQERGGKLRSVNVTFLSLAKRQYSDEMSLIPQPYYDSDSLLAPFKTCFRTPLRAAQMP